MFGSRTFEGNVKERKTERKIRRKEKANENKEPISSL